MAPILVVHLAREEQEARTPKRAAMACDSKHCEVRSRVRRGAPGKEPT